MTSPSVGSATGTEQSRDAAVKTADGGIGVLERRGPKSGERRADNPKVGGSSPSPRILFRSILKHVSIKWGERLGRAECPYLRRWVFAFGVFSVRVHHFYRSDDARSTHDHPWWFFTLVLRGAYYDVTDRKIDHLKTGSTRFRPSSHAHTVMVDYGPTGTDVLASRHGHADGVWTLVLTGPNVRQWGFFVRGKHVKANKYFFAYGHHPCDQN